MAHTLALLSLSLSLGSECRKMNGGESFNTPMMENITETSAQLFTWKPHLEVDITMGVLLLACFSCGLFGNCIAFKYFSTQRRDLSNIIYIMIVAVDIINSVLMFSPGVSYFKERSPFLLTYRWVCNSWGVAFHVSSRLSVFLVATLSISRTVSLTFPFKQVRRRHVLIPTGVYLFTLIIPALFPFYYGKEYRLVYQWPRLHFITMNTLRFFNISSHCDFCGHLFPFLPQGTDFFM